MNAPEQGFLLLTSSLGDPMRKPLTVAQFRTLSQRVKQTDPPSVQREMTEADFISLGYDHVMAQRILTLLSQKDQLYWYLAKGRQANSFPISRISANYPAILRKRLGLDAPGCLWAKGDLTLLETKAIALVGSRELQHENLIFAREAGKQAALQGFTLVSGNARGADREAQNACLEAGGSVISVIADRLEKCPVQKNVLFLSEDGFNLEFTTQRALSRNRIIHCLGLLTFVAQCSLQKGGTWDGTVQNLRKQWGTVCCYQDGTPAMRELEQKGATPITIKQLADIPALQYTDPKFF